jgi:TonB-linked SusC/RagA family outer membrane protein
MNYLRQIGVLICALMSTAVWAQTVSGTVTDENNQPLPGATVIVEGTNRGTSTDFDGRYSINAAQGETLAFSYVGYATQKVSISAATHDVMMQLDNTLEEVVVMGYGTQNRSEITGSAVQVGADEINSFPVTSADQVLQGKVAGLSLSTTSGVPGSIQNIRIRGRSSVTASNSPLFVIDGVPVNNTGLQRSTSGSTFSPLANINPESIESITVLKDPSATAPYGARGTNGVIVITTKKGKAGGKPTISLSTSFGFQNDAINGPEMLTGAEREVLYYEGLLNTYGKSYNLATIDDAKQFYLDNPNSFGTQYKTWNNQGRKETRWQDYVTNKDAPIRTYDVSATGGNENVSYFISLGHLDQEATVIGASAKRYTGAITLNIKLNNVLRFNTQNNVGYVEQDGVLEQSAYFASARAVKFFSPPIWNPYNSDGSYNFNVQGGNYNPLYLAENDINLSKVTRTTSNNSLTWETPIENLTYTSTLGIDNQRINYKVYYNRVHGGGIEEGGQASVADLNRTVFTIQNSLNYKLNFDNHVFNFTLLQEYQNNRNTWLTADGESFAANGLTNLDSAGKPTDVGGGFSDWHLGSYLGLINYNYKGKYLFNGSYRREGNSRFDPNTRWGGFWAVGLGWNIHEEDFMEDVSFVNNLKLRTSYGLTGNAGIGINTYQATLGYSVDYGGTAGIFPSSYGQKNLRWEVANSFEAGLDFDVFNNRLNGVFSYYRRETKDMLQEVPLSETTGHSEQNQNIGVMTNSGIELELGGDMINNEDMTLRLSGQIGTNKNIVTKLAKDGKGEEINISTSTRRVATGHTVYEWYMVSYAGVNPDNGNALYYTDENLETTTEDFTKAERVWQGKGAIPTLLAGLNLNFNYKSFFLTTQVNYAGGHKVWEDWTRYTNGSDRFATDWYNGINKLMNRWQKPGDITDVPKITHGAAPWRIFNRFLYDGDYIRLRDLTIGFNFNESKALSNIGITNAKVYLRGLNLYTWVKDKNFQYDPEVEAEGFAGLTNPPTKNFIIGVNIKF